MNDEYMYANFVHVVNNAAHITHYHNLRIRYARWLYSFEFQQRRKEKKLHCSLKYSNESWHGVHHTRHTRQKDGPKMRFAETAQFRSSYLPFGGYVWYSLTFLRNKQRKNQKKEFTLWTCEIRSWHRHEYSLFTLHIIVFAAVNVQKQKIHAPPACCSVFFIRNSYFLLILFQLHLKEKKKIHFQEILRIISSFSEKCVL